MNTTCKARCPHVVVFYFYTKMSKVYQSHPSRSRMSLSNLYKSSLLLLERYTIRTDGLLPPRSRNLECGRITQPRTCELLLPPPPSLTYTFRRTVRIVGSFCTYYGVIMWVCTMNPSLVYAEAQDILRNQNARIHCVM